MIKPKPSKIFVQRVVAAIADGKNRNGEFDAWLRARVETEHA